MIVPSTPGVVIPVVVPGVTGGVTTTVVLAFAREIGPKYPAAGLIPFAACHAATAACVRDPKYPIATPAGITR